MSTQHYELQPGTVLDGRYRIEKKIGEGGFGITYLGVGLHQNEKVAIKEFFWKNYMERKLPGTSEVFLSREEDRKDYEHQKKRFLREARILREFAGEPGIVQVRDYFEENGTAYIVLDFIEGHTLKQELAGGKTMEAEQAFRRLLPLMETLKKVHETGLIHRDISPDNIMVNEKGQMILIDFGAARDYWKVADETRSVILKGGYAACEQYDRHGRLGPWTDVYGLCAVLYFCITGHAPDDGFQRLLHDEQKSPRELGISMDPGLEKILMKGLEVEQSSRYQSMDAFLGAVRQIVREKDPREIRRKWLIRGGILLACLCAVLGLGYWYYQSHLEQFKFGGADTLHLAFSRPENIADEEFERLLDDFEQRTEVIVGEDNHIIRPDEEEIQAVLPAEPYRQMLEADRTGYEELSDLLTMTLAKTGRLSLDGLKLSGEKGIEQAKIQKGQVKGFSSEYITEEEYYYIEVQAAKELAGKIEEKTKEKEAALQLFLDRDWSGDVGYTGLVSAVSVVYDDKDASRFWLVPTVQDPVFCRLLLYDLTHEPRETAMGGSFLTPATWEEVDTSMFAGTCQVDEEDIADPAVYVDFTPGSTDENMPSGQWYNTVSDFKTMLDALEIPYAFGESRMMEHQIVVKVSREHYYPELMDMMTDKNARVTDCQETIAGFYYSSTEKEQFLEQQDPYAWQIACGEEWQAEDILEGTTASCKAGRMTLYLEAADYKLAETTLDEPIADGVFTFSDLHVDTDRISSKKVYRFLKTMVQQVTNDSYYTCNGAAFTDGKGSLQSEADSEEFRILKRDRLEAAQKAAAAMDEGIEVWEGDSPYTLYISLPEKETENMAADTAETIRNLLQESGLTDGYYSYIRCFVKGDTLDEGESLRFDFSFSLGGSLTVQMGDVWQEKYLKELKEYLKTDEFYRQYANRDSFTIYE